MKSSLYPVQELKRRTLAWAVKLRVNPRIIRVQDMRHKWGSCSTAGTVTLATDLLQQDLDFQDYVIVHELLHLRYPAHGRLFKACMGAHLPQWRGAAESPLQGSPSAPAPMAANRKSPSSARKRHGSHCRPNGRIASGASR